MPTPATPSLPLHDLPEDRWATVVRTVMPINNRDRELVLRLVELGFVAGERVRIVAQGHPGREPLAVRIGRTTFALRRHEASFILVDPTV